ncbi:MAG: PAS domain S-box protein [Acidobacteriota bacterium]
MVLSIGTQESSAEEKAQAAQALLAAIVETSDDAIISKTLGGIITSWNAGAERHFGYTAEEAIGRHISLLIPPDRLDEEDLIIGRLKIGARVEHFDTIRVRKDGRHLQVSLTISPIRDSSGNIVGASKIARDITERKDLEDELRRYAADLSEADRRKNEFLAMLAHELRNPLAPIRNSIQVLRATNDGLGAPLEIMDRQVGQLVRLVDDLLDVSRITSGKIELRRERIDLNAVILHTAEAARPSCESGGVDLEISLPERPIWLIGDPARLTQSIGNLLNNSCKFTDKGGSIHLTLESNDQHALVKVRDTGIGIAPEKLSRIFEMFVQADTSLERATSGLGIGLTLVKNLVEMHGGTVEARSEGLGHGCEFVLELPLVAVETPEAKAENLVDEGSKGPAGKKILVVDDNVDSAESLTVLLRLSGHDVRLAHDGIEAVKISDEFRPDVILLDIGLPRLNGYEAARVIRRRPWGDGVQLIALTGWGQKEDRERSKDAGFDIHLVKPVDHDELFKLLSDLEPE